MEAAGKRIIVSACLLGVPCRYDGQAKACQAVLDFCDEAERVVRVCPECAGGLPTPRTPSERVGSRVLMRDGTDVTEAFLRGALSCLQQALDADVDLALLKARSPSCGSGTIYDGSFSATLTAGDGVFTELLREHAIPVLSEEDL